MHEENRSRTLRAALVGLAVFSAVVGLGNLAARRSPPPDAWAIPPASTASAGEVASHVAPLEVAPASSSSSYTTLRIGAPAWPTSPAACSRCGRALHFPDEPALTVAEAQTFRPVFKGCLRCLIEALDDYARITSSSLTEPRR